MHIDLPPPTLSLSLLATLNRRRGGRIVRDEFALSLRALLIAAPTGNRIGVELFVGTRIQTGLLLIVSFPVDRCSRTRLRRATRLVREVIFYRVIRRIDGAEAKRPIRGCVLSVDSKTLDRARVASGGKKEEEKGRGKGEEKGYSRAGALLDRARFRVDGMDRCKSPRARADNGARVDPREKWIRDL